jgi:TonB family protein
MRQITLALSILLHLFLFMLLAHLHVDVPRPTSRTIEVMPVRPVSEPPARVLVVPRQLLKLRPAVPPPPAAKPVPQPPKAKPVPQPQPAQAKPRIPAQAKPQPAPQKSLPAPPPAQARPRPSAPQSQPHPPPPPIPKSIPKAVPPAAPKAAPKPPPKPQGPMPIIVRPFVEKGGKKGESRGLPEGAGPDHGQKLVKPDRLIQAAPPAAKPTQPKPDIGELKPKKLAIDIDAFNRRLREAIAIERDEAPPFSSEQNLQTVPFGTPNGLDSETGDGTNSTAIGGSAFFDAKGYDITPWAKRMVYGVKKNWIIPPVQEYGMGGMVGVYLVVEKDGRISTLSVQKASGLKPFDQAAVNAIRLSDPFPPLPQDFPNANLPAYFVFRYN